MDVVSVDGLTVEFDGAEGRKRVVDDVSFSIPQKQTVALVGESGSGKTVISQAIMGLLPRNALITSGSILFRDPDRGGEETDIAALNRTGRRMRDIRGNRIAIIFQEPMTSLSPLHTIGDQIGEAVRLHRGKTLAEAREITREMLGLVHFPEPKRALDTYPFELSGGLRQRAMIAMALVCRPALLVADEPTTALDVTIQAEILKLIKEMQSELDMSVLVITHDFGVVANMADEVVVIYHGRIMERGSSDASLPQSAARLSEGATERRAPLRHGRQDERLIPIRPIEPQANGFLTKGDRKHVEPGKPLLDIEGRGPRRSRCARVGCSDRKSVRSVRSTGSVSPSIAANASVLSANPVPARPPTAKAILARHRHRRRYDSLRPRQAGLEDITSFSGENLMDYRRRVQLIFQDPFSSLNPRMTVNDILSEPLVIHEDW